MSPFIENLTKPDNIPIVAMLLLVPFCLFIAMRQAIRNDRLIAQGGESVEATLVKSKTHTWPYLVRIEFLALLVMLLVLMVWSITIDAPLEEPANPAETPNPSKAPWYFAGLQESLVYFDPWIAGVVIPTIIVIGLMLIPYLDINPKGSGYYTFRERKFAILTFCFGFIGLWITLITIGIFLRGPGWNIFMPWEPWDPHKVTPLINVDLPYKFGIRSYWSGFIFGGLVIGGYYSLGGIFYVVFRKKSKFIQELGLIRYTLVAFLFLTMMSLPIKILLTLLLNIKYIWVTPWFNI
jgi:hypothetical protein